MTAMPFTTTAGVQPASGSDTDQAQAQIQTPAQAPSGPVHEPDVFICYSSVDREKVEEIVKRLGTAGLQVCVDYRDMLVGEAPQGWMERQTDRCRHVLPVMTPAWLKSDWAAFELMLTTARDPAGRLRRVTPVMLEKCDPPPRITARINFAKLYDPACFESEWKRLIESLRDGVEAARPLSPDDARSARKGLHDLAALLRTPEVRDKVVMFKEVFRSACTQIALVSEFKTLHDKLQDLQIIGCRPVALLRRGAGSGEPDWENLDVEGQNLLGPLDDLVKAARGVSFATKESLWVVKLESAGRLFDQAVAGRDKAKLDRACGIIDETVVKRLSAINRSLVDAVRVLNLQSLVDCLSEVRGKLEGMPLDEAASERREGFTKGLEKLADMKARLAALVARHDEFQSIEDELTSAHGAIREDFDSFLFSWEPVYERILSAGGNAWPEPLRASADVVNAAVGDRNPYKTEKSFQKFLYQLSHEFKHADTDLLTMCKQLQDLRVKELATPLEMMSDV